MSLSGCRQKKYMVYLDKTENESFNSFNQRMLFILRNISKTNYEELGILSKYYYNICVKGMKYKQQIHDKINEMN
jgi:hypothetical protein